jgi:uncharacterized membrane protein YfhO
MEPVETPPRKKDRHLQGISHLLIIALVPLLLTIIFFTPSWLIKVFFIALLLFLFVFIWKRIIKKSG